MIKNQNKRLVLIWQALSVLFAGDKSRSGRVKASELDYDDVKLLKESILFFPLNFLGHIYLSAMKKNCNSINIYLIYNCNILTNSNLRTQTGNQKKKSSFVIKQQNETIGTMTPVHIFSIQNILRSYSVYVLVLYNLLFLLA